MAQTPLYRVGFQFKCSPEYMAPVERSGGSHDKETLDTMTLYALTSVISESRTLYTFIPWRFTTGLLLFILHGLLLTNTEYKQSWKRFWRFSSPTPCASRSPYIIPDKWLSNIFIKPSSVGAPTTSKGKLFHSLIVLAGDFLEVSFD